MVIAVSGKLSIKRDEIQEVIENNGGKFAKSITKAVTHVVCADKDAQTQKLTKAKQDGKEIVGEDFLTKLM